MILFVCTYFVHTLSWEFLLLYQLNRKQDSTLPSTLFHVFRPYRAEYLCFSLFISLDLHVSRNSLKVSKGRLDPLLPFLICFPYRTKTWQIYPCWWSVALFSRNLTGNRSRQYLLCFSSFDFFFLPRVSKYIHTVFLIFVETSSFIIWPQLPMERYGMVSLHGMTVLV